MSQVVRDPNGAFACPRCGRPVLYKGRGRRPVWCSARCRVEASIERRGNRVVGVQPRVVTVVPPKQRVSEWEQNERRRIQETLTRETLTAMVADDPFLLSTVLEPVKVSARSRTEAERRALARDLRRVAQVISPETPAAAGSDAWPLRGHGWKRSPSEWAVLLDELADQLGNGQFYSRDLPLIDEPMNRVAERYLRRRQGR
jgi:DNA-directed RNA polymerase subunit RPC12/RpoP